MVTLKEISSKTGYSIATISRVLNEDKTLSVTDSTRKKILQAAGELDYERQPRGRQKESEVYLAGIIEMDTFSEFIDDPYYMYLKKDIEQKCLEERVETVLLQYDSEADCYLNHFNKKLDGIIAIGQFSDKQIKKMCELSQIILFVDSSPYEDRFSSVVPNYYVGMSQGIDYLAGIGHRKIAFVGPKMTLDSLGRESSETRYMIFSEYIANYYNGIVEGVRLNTQNVDTGHVIEQYIKEDPDPAKVFFCYNEKTAINVVRGILNLGCRIPEDFGVVSYNDTVLATLTQPNLTGIKIPIKEMAAIAVRMFKDAVGEKEWLPVKIQVPSKLVIRESLKVPKSS